MQTYTHVLSPSPPGCVCRHDLSSAKLKFWLISNCKKLRAVLCRVPLQLLFFPLLLNGKSHVLNIIIKCFIPPIKSVMPNLISEWVLRLLLTAPSPKRSQQNNIFSRHYLLYWLNLLEASWPWILIAAVASAACLSSHTEELLGTERSSKQLLVVPDFGSSCTPLHCASQLRETSGLPWVLPCYNSLLRLLRGKDVSGNKYTPEFFPTP